MSKSIFFKDKTTKSNIWSLYINRVYIDEKFRGCAVKSNRCAQNTGFNGLAIIYQRVFSKGVCTHTPTLRHEHVFVFGIVFAIDRIVFKKEFFLLPTPTSFTCVTTHVPRIPRAGTNYKSGLYHRSLYI